MSEEAPPVLTRERLRNFNRDPLVIKTRSSVILHLRWLSTGDMEFLSRLSQEESDDKTFLARLLEHQFVGPPGQVSPAKLSTVQLLEAFIEWAPHRSALSTVVPADVDVTVARRLVEVVIERWEAPVREMAARLKDYVIPATVVTQIAGVGRLQSMMSQIRSDFVVNLARTLAPMREAAVRAAALHVRSFPLPDLYGLFNALPDIGHITRVLTESRDGKAVLDEAGYGFTVDLWELDSVRGLARNPPSILQSTVRCLTIPAQTGSLVN
jgi:hypothetical protein